MSSEKAPDAIKREYQNTLRKAKVATAAFAVLWLPYLFLNITESQSLLGIDRSMFFAIAVTGLLGYAAFFVLVWKCPNCGNFPGSGWARTSCRSCGVSL